MSAQLHRYCRPGGNIEIIEERYADPRKPNLCKLWVVNGQHEFKKQWNCRSFMSELANKIGGDGKFPDDESFKQAYSKIIPTYTEEVYKATIG